ICALANGRRKRMPQTEWAPYMFRTAKESREAIFEEIKKSADDFKRVVHVYFAIFDLHRNGWNEYWITSKIYQISKKRSLKITSRGAIIICMLPIQISTQLTSENAYRP
ncbi:hypothetical protein PFISCL1PPCAC_4790, partial [Pristionchus fissidentatus]